MGRKKLITYILMLALIGSVMVPVPAQASPIRVQPMEEEGQSLQQPQVILLNEGAGTKYVNKKHRKACYG